MSKRMIARYAGTCQKCHGTIRPGQEIDYHGYGNATHVTCPKNMPPTAPAPEPSFEEKFAAIGKDISPEQKFSVHFYDGEYLSDYMVSAEGAYNGENYRALEAMGIARYVSGWGNKISEEAHSALGDSFTFAQAKDYAHPLLAAEDAQRQTAKAARQTARDAKFAEAKTTGKPVVLRTWSEECNDPREECNIDNLTEYAMPDGTTKVVRSHTW